MTKRTTYTHYTSFTRALLKSAEKVSRLAGNPSNSFNSREYLLKMLTSPEFDGSIDLECIALEHAFERNAGKILLPEPELVETLTNIRLSPVEGLAWNWPYKYSMISLPSKLKFAGVKAEGIMVSWLDASEVASGVYIELYKHHGIKGKVLNPKNLSGRVLVVTMRGESDNIMPSMIRYAFTEAELTRYINDQAMKDASRINEQSIRPISEGEKSVFAEAMRLVLAMGFYLSAYPDALTAGVPEYVGTKLPKHHVGTNVAVGLRSTKDFRVVTSPYGVDPHWRQLRDERYYRGDNAHLPRGSRYTLVSGYEVHGERATGVEPR